MTQEKTEKLQALYEELIDPISEDQMAELEGKGYAVGKQYADSENRLLVVGKVFHFEDTDFWNPVQKIAHHLLGEHDPQWTEKVAFSSLYKLTRKEAPKLPRDLIDMQQDFCKKILKAEIDFLQPTHVLFLTGWTGIWDFDLPIVSVMKGETIEGIGKTENGALLMVTRSNVRQLEGKFVHDVLECIENQKEG